MKAVIDESVPRALVRLLRVAGCDAHAFPSEWKGLASGGFLAVIEESEFGCLITCDKNMAFQQNLSVYGLLLVVLPFQKLEVLASLVDEISATVNTANDKSVYVIASSRSDERQ